MRFARGESHSITSDPCCARIAGGYAVSHRFTSAAFVLVALSAVRVSAQAAPQPPPDAQALRAAIDDLKKDFEARLSALETRLAAIEGGAPAPERAPAPLPAPEQEPAPVPGQAAASGSKVFNPDMAVIGDFLGTAGGQDGPGQQRHAESGVRDARVGGVLPGGRRSVRPRRFLHLVRRRRRQPRRGLHHAHVAARAGC